jgi:hypothetical protein
MLIKQSLLLLFAWCAMTVGVCAQPIGSPSVHKSTGSYADLYKQQLKQTHRTAVSARTYTVNKQFAHNPNLSPYLNLTRPGGTYTPNYQAYVKPEIARRQNAQTRYNNQSHPGRPAGNTKSASRGNPYYSKYYTGR